MSFNLRKSNVKDEVCYELYLNDNKTILYFTEEAYQDFKNFLNDNESKYFMFLELDANELIVRDHYHGIDYMILKSDMLKLIETINKEE